ncbi:DNA-DIRECTED RNA POLYMERASE III, putative [Babesia caballi]|uniref:DNA-DIRECTED RNA POLYMERASE III, putative n=1 Tax=Babesia caballi TaxID=5871 RepID=A0AAV4LMH3_BABCB|nr:DNA-DIRECTED RNA POLYMERASE III, putative [Babesia caballi]
MSIQSKRQRVARDGAQAAAAAEEDAPQPFDFMSLCERFQLEETSSTRPEPPAPSRPSNGAICAVGEAAPRVLAKKELVKNAVTRCTIEGVQFDVMDRETISRLAELQIMKRELYDNNTEPLPLGVLDLKLDTLLHLQEVLVPAAAGPPGEEVPGGAQAADRRPAAQAAALQTDHAGVPQSHQVPALRRQARGDPADREAGDGPVHEAAARGQVQGRREDADGGGGPEPAGGAAALRGHRPHPREDTERGSAGEAAHHQPGGASGKCDALSLDSAAELHSPERHHRGAGDHGGRPDVHFLGHCGAEQRVEEPDPQRQPDQPVHPQLAVPPAAVHEAHQRGRAGRVAAPRLAQHLQAGQGHLPAAQGQGGALPREPQREARGLLRQDRHLAGPQRRRGRGGGAGVDRHEADVPREGDGGQHRNHEEGGAERGLHVAGGHVRQEGERREEQPAVRQPQAHERPPGHRRRGAAAPVGRGRGPLQPAAVAAQDEHHGPPGAGHAGVDLPVQRVHLRGEGGGAPPHERAPQPDDAAERGAADRGGAGLSVRELPAHVEGQVPHAGAVLPGVLPLHGRQGAGGPAAAGADIPRHAVDGEAGLQRAAEAEQGVQGGGEFRVQGAGVPGAAAGDEPVHVPQGRLRDFPQLGARGGRAGEKVAGSVKIWAFLPAADEEQPVHCSRLYAQGFQADQPLAGRVRDDHRPGRRAAGEGPAASEAQAAAGRVREGGGGDPELRHAAGAAWLHAGGDAGVAGEAGAGRAEKRGGEGVQL